MSLPKLPAPPAGGKKGAKKAKAAAESDGEGQVLEGSGREKGKNYQGNGVLEVRKREGGGQGSKDIYTYAYFSALFYGCDWNEASIHYNDTHTHSLSLSLDYLRFNADHQESEDWSDHPEDD